MTEIEQTGLVSEEVDAWPSEEAPSTRMSSIIYQHYQYYSKCDIIPNVSLSDYAPTGFWHYPWCICVAVGSRLNMPRMDNFFVLGYWKKHGLYYSTCWLIYFGILSLNFVTFEVSMTAALVSMLMSWCFYYVLVWGVLAKPDRFMSKFSSRAAALQFWEAFVWAAWSGLLLTYTLLSKVNFEATEGWLLGADDFGKMKRFYHHPATLAFACVLIVVGALVKSYACYLTGVNNYYYYDIILNRPNERFVQSKLYKLFSSPTYHIGYIDGYGVALLCGFHQYGSPLLILLYTASSQSAISILNALVEQKFVRKMYLKSD